ncbi:acyl-CoA N-acyltransferase [Penicillium macrosclerotiorum]|uniref:acyl-CoA N-acyltransferase n=1 Tax=Penicillium macrosclerotiorum TaxID=303699 RepID=UPI0025478DF7|nr:acyl-CoA N-acyltransferase [Penicillium macrosclerotiorum]KAJ5690667.1 acyl-CoA N-acyltransferase [Penicillium macrosclerotiorum]
MGSANQISDPPFILRTHQPGDIGWIIHRHGLLYYKEFGWDERFEALVAGIAADFINQYDPDLERCWVAEKAGEFLGCVMIVKHSSKESTAKLRLLLVEPSARGLGVGRALVQQCEAFAREAGYKRIELWTNKILTSARRLYTSEGYKCISEEEHSTFGIKSTGETWVREL